MINFVFFLLIILLILGTGFAIIGMVKLDNAIKNVIENNDFLNQKIIITADKIKKCVKLKPKEKEKIKYIDIFLMTTDILLTEIYKAKYEKLKLFWDFIKATMA